MTPHPAAVRKIYDELTEANNHGEALLVLARATGRTVDAKILEHVNAICDLEGELPRHLNEYRYEKSKAIHAAARQQNFLT